MVLGERLRVSERSAMIWVKFCVNVEERDRET